MAITILTGGTQTGGTNNGGNVTLTFPTLAANDVVIVFGGHNATAGQSAIPAGYTTIYDSGAANPTPHFGISYKVMGTTPDTTVVCPGDGAAADGTAYGCYCLRGVDLGSIQDATRTVAGPTTSNNPDCPSINTATDGALVLALALDHLAGTGDVVITAPAGYGNLRNARGTDSNDATIGGATLIKASFGTEDPASFTAWTAGTWRSATVAIRPLVFWALSAAELATAAPVLGAPDITQAYALVGGLTTDAPVLGAPTLGVLTEEYTLVAAALTVAAPVLDAPSVAQAHALVGGLTTANPVFGAPDIGQAHALVGGLTTDAPVLGAPVITQAHVLVGGLTTAAPVLDAPMLGVELVLVAGGLTTTAPVIGAPSLVQQHALSAAELAVQAPALGAPVLSSGAQNALWLGDRVLDYGLSALAAEADMILICSDTPADYAEAVALALGTGASTFGAPTAGTPAGRVSTSTPIASATVSANGTPTCWAAVDSVNSRLLAVGPADGLVPVNTAAAWSLGAIPIHLNG